MHGVGGLQRLLGSGHATARGAQRKVRATDGEDELLMSAGESDVGDERIGARRLLQSVTPAEVEQQPLQRD